MQEYNPWKDHTESDRNEINGKFVFKPDDISTLTTRLEYDKWYQQNPGTLTQAQFTNNWQQAGLVNQYQDFEYLIGAANYKRQFGSRGELEVSFSRRTQSGIDAGSAATNTPSTANKIDYAENNSHTLYRQDFDFVQSRVYGGLDIINGYQNVALWNRATNSTNLNLTSLNTASQFNETQISPFAQYEFSPLTGLFSGNQWLSSLDRLRFNFGVREEIYAQQITQSYVSTGKLHDGDNTYSRLIKKGGLSFEYLKEHTLWFSMADGWLVPGTSATVTSLYPNYNLSPESHFTKELGLRGFFRDTNLSYDVTAYESNINNYITSALCRDNPTACKGWTNTAANATQSYSAALGNVDARGFETALSYRPYELIKLDVAHTLTWNVWDTYYSTTGSGSATRTLVMHGNTLQNSSKHHVNGRITLYPLPGWSIELESDYISRYNTNQLDNNAYQRPMLFNLRSSYKWKNWTLSLQGMNILDTKYASRVTTNATGSVASYNTLAGVGDGPFSFRAGLQYNF